MSSLYLCARYASTSITDNVEFHAVLFPMLSARSTINSKPLPQDIVSDCTIQWGVQLIAAFKLTRDTNFIHINFLRCAGAGGGVLCL